MHPDSLHPNDLIGVTRHGSRWRIFAGTVAEWILDYASYDPGFDPSRSEVMFRGNLLVVSEQNADQFHAAMEPYELQPSELEAFVHQVGRYNWPLSMVVSFDDKLYVNGFSEIPLHEYLPPGWSGIEGQPIDFVPPEIRQIWEMAPGIPPSL